MYHFNKKLPAYLLILCLALISVNPAFGQQKTAAIKGTVYTSGNKAAEGVTITLKGKNKTTITDNDGAFELNNIMDGNFTLIVSLIGNNDVQKEVTIKNNETTIVDITLTLSNNELNQVVILSNKSAFKTNRVSSSLRLQSPIIEIPQNIQVITGKLINDQQIFNMLEGVTRNVSGATRVEHWDNYANITMRGSQVAAFRNGMNISSTWGPLTEDMSMVERIEFVKGPAGFMLANGNPSGFYNVVTKKPSGRSKGEATFTFGSFDMYRGTLDFDGKLTNNGKLLYRINVMGEKKGSYRDFDFNDRYSFAPVLKYLISDKTAVTLEYTQQFSKVNAVGANYLFSHRGYADLPRTATTSEANLDPTKMTERNILAIVEHKINDNWKFTAQSSYLNYQQEGMSLWPSGFDTTNDAILKRAGGIWDILGKIYVGQAYVNGEAQTGAVSHKILSGIDLSDKTFYHDWMQYFTMPDLDIYNPVHGTLAASPTFDRSQSLEDRGVKYQNNYKALYVQDELGFLDYKLRLTLAGRYTVLKSGNYYSGDTKNSRFTPRVGLSYSIDKNTAAYFVNDQSFNENYGADWQGNSFKPETGGNIELGLKRDWLNGKWNSVFSLYQITKNNVLTADPEHSTSVMQYSRESGQQRTKGFEVDIRGEIFKNLDLILNYAFTEGKTTKDTDESIIGKQVAGTTKHIQNAWLNYKIDRGTLNGVGFSLGYQYQVNRAPWFISTDNTTMLPDYFRLDGGISYQKNKVSVNLVVNNILNKYLYSGGYYTYSDMYYWQAEAGTNARVTVAYKF
ncbi:TonB-dependent receptor [Flavobacterium degerlachei]|jgi:iron complex outermembrane receptor protein|uniref:Iron complex outermembrane recepter protein n=1 Tax=Flavobacterium degerlachei TaxID=229203 RepID=A0A1H2XC85_9FLAO|nr:TonB-dependent receptor [Flavobacterium degerlachei]SDW90460.1 iron complex outermembrane recepter protein [Flavobacterium degerlachei]